MKCMAVLRCAWSVYRKNLSDLLLLLLVELLIGCMAAAPLLLLAYPGASWLAALSPALTILLVLPMRQNAAEALQHLLSGQRACTAELLCMRHYWRKVGRGLITLLWTLPLLAGIVVALVFTKGSTDGFTLMRYITSIGGGDLQTGCIIILMVYLLTLVPILFGCAFHSGTRHAAALGETALVRGRRGHLMALWLTGTALWLPGLLVIAAVLANYLSAQLKLLLDFNFVLAPLGMRLWLIAAAVLLLMLPLAPLRALLPAIDLRAEQEKRHAQA